MKIKALCALVLLTLTASLASAQSVTRCGGPSNALYINWPMFQFDDCRTGYNPYETRLNTDSVKNLAIAWQYTASGYFTGAPVLMNGVLYFGSYSPGAILAVYASTGTLKWQYPIAGAGNEGSSPAVVNGVVYLGAGDGNVYALDANTGTLLWKYTTGGDIDGSSPAVANGMVYVGSSDHNMYALSAKTGALVWKYDTSETIAASPAVVNGIVYFVTVSGNLYALNAGNGTPLWKYAVGGNPKTYPPTVINGVVYFGDGIIYAIDALTGTLRWQVSGLPVDINDVVFANNVVYAVARNYDPEQNFETAYAFDAKMGTQLWKSRPAQNAYNLVGANGVLYAIAYDFPSVSMVAMDAGSGNHLAGYSLQSVGSTPPPPLIANGFLYLGWSDGSGHYTLYAYHLPNQ